MAHLRNENAIKHIENTILVTRNIHFRMVVSVEWHQIIEWKAKHPLNNGCKKLFWGLWSINTNRILQSMCQHWSSFHPMSVQLGEASKQNHVTSNIDHWTPNLNITKFVNIRDCYTITSISAENKNKFLSGYRRTGQGNYSSLSQSCQNKISKKTIQPHYMGIYIYTYHTYSCIYPFIFVVDHYPHRLGCSPTE